MFCGRHHTLEGCISGMFNFQLSRRPQCSISSCKPLVTLCVSVRSYCGVLHARCKIACAPLSPPCAHRITCLAAQCSCPYSMYRSPCPLVTLHSAALILPSLSQHPRLLVHVESLLARSFLYCSCTPLVFLCVVDRSRCGTASLAQLVPVRSFLLWCSSAHCIV